jgi:excisionase family DNA binding protein
MQVVTEFLNTQEAATLLGLKPQTLHLWRSAGRYNLPFVRLGRAVRYRREDIEQFVASCRVVPAGEAATGA